MCRMIAAIGKDIPIKSVLTEFRSFCEIGKVPQGYPPGHKDGWGVGIAEDGSFSVTKNYLPASDDPKYQDTVDQLPSSFSGILLAHLRKATRGSITTENNHPFQKNNFLFMHNGTVKYEDNQKSDSIKYFDSLVKLSKEHDHNVSLGYSKFNEYLAKNTIDYSSITSVLSSQTDLWAYRKYRIDEQYYTLYYQQHETFILISQQPINSDPWTALENNDLLHINYHDLQPRVTQV